MARSTMDASTPSSLSFGTCPVRNWAMPRVASATPTNSASASCGRTSGSGPPRLMPAVSGVRPMTRYAASAGHFHTQATITITGNASSAGSGASAMAVPTAVATRMAGKRSHGFDGRAGGIRTMAGCTRLPLTIDYLRHDPMVFTVRADQSPGEPSQFWRPPQCLEREEQRSPDEDGRGDPDARAERTPQEVRHGLRHEPRGTGHDAGSGDRPGQRGCEPLRSPRAEGAPHLSGQMDSRGGNRQGQRQPEHHQHGRPLEQESRARQSQADG